MSTRFSVVSKPRPASGFPLTEIPGSTSGAISEKLVQDRYRSLSQSVSDAPKKESAATLEQKLFDALVNAKVSTSHVAMHLENEWRQRLFRQLDSLMAIEDWDASDAPLEGNSFSTFLRTILFLRPKRAPGLGMTSTGEIVAAWTKDQDRLTMEFGNADQVRWTLSRVDSGGRERAAGETYADRMEQVLAPYFPDRWFER